MSNKKIPVITVDGPSGAGKGTLSALLARRLGYRLLDSGAVYRILALAALRQGIPLDDSEALARLAAHLQMRFDVNEGGVQTALLEDQDVTADIRTESCANAASRIATLEQVRAALLQKQREFCRSPGLVADGRDMGSVVFPQADKKIFLVASLAERARRRYKQLKGQGNDASLDALLNELAKRDERDENRSVAPLKPAEDAIIIDSTGLSIDEVIERALKLVR
jgi:cytidylate kinase